MRAAGQLLPRRGVSVWLPYWEMSAALSSATANAAEVGSASPFWYSISGDSTVVDQQGAADPSVIDALHREAIMIVPTVTESDGMRAFDRVLASASQRAAMVHALSEIAASNADYRGLDLDFEDFAVDPQHDAAPANAAARLFPAFVAQVCGALHRIGRSCTITIMPRTGDGHSYWRHYLATWVYDYPALARVADRIRVMAYDEHAPGDSQGPVAPYRWVEQVISYVRATIPAGKVELALPAYGYVWTGASASSITAREAPLLAAAHGTSPSWNAVQGEETFSYRSGGHRYTVWYEDARADVARARLAANAGFAGIALWAAGGEDPSVWPMLRALLAHQG